ncbi:porin [uncultured Roseibium sp.]|uniref:porin n=1 Tax=uncultured Roseibium sp. TaxID=1936171 RepID=UPI003217B064
MHFKNLSLCVISAALVCLETEAGFAQEADLPVAPEPVDYVRLCDAYGLRFYYVPGTETCLRVGGRLRVDYRLNNFGSSPNDWDSNEDNATSFLARAYIYLDARTQTEFGLLRTYTSVYFSNINGAQTPEVEYAFIELGGFTFGEAQSFYDFWTGYSFGVQLTDYSDVKNRLLAYTAGFGNGLSATLSIEESMTRQSLLIAPATPATSANGNAGMRLPDLVGNLRIEQGWGSAQIMGALHHVKFADTTAKGTLGWALGGGVEVNVPALGQGDAIALQIGYADGANGYPMDSWDSQITDAINTGGVTRTTRSWNIGGGWNHNFTDMLEANLEGGYHVADAATNARDFSQWGLTGNLVWHPVGGLDIGTELQYRRVDYKAASGLADKDELYATFRVQRTF